jgi:cyclomaltodextrinase / maltogenic alpha-amylase / neopullulanase
MSPPGTPPPSTIPDSVRLTHAPAWARGAVWYQIFPERFRNGDPRNDPTVNDIVGAWPHEKPATWQVSRWTGDWYALQPWEAGKDFYYRAQERRYGGDLKGILDKLDYLQDLGVTAIYLNPIFQSPSLHKYDAAMYHHVDKNFGPDPAGDEKIWASENPGDPATWRWSSADTMFLGLIRAVHQRGMRIIIDGVFNHVGTSFWAFRDVRLRGKNSPYASWFTITQFDDPATPANEFAYQGWMGVRDLPEFREDEHGLVAGPREHVHAVVKRWMDPNGDGNPSDGIDGWRLDVAEMVAIPFWREFRQWVRAINPDGYITGEIWWEDWRTNKMFEPLPWLRGDVFDAVMNYRWASAAVSFFRDHKTTPSEFASRLDSLLHPLRPEVNDVLMNLYGSHDTDRLGSMLVNRNTVFDHRVSAKDDSSYNVRKPNAAELKLQKLMVLFQMTALGSPMVYYGDEAGMWGGDDPDERKPMLWADMTFDNERSHPFGLPRPDDPNVFDADLFAYYRAAIALRHRLAPLRLGTQVSLPTPDGSGVLILERSLGDDHVVIALNPGVNALILPLPLESSLAARKWKLEYGNGSVSRGNNGWIVGIPGADGVVLGTVHE